MKVNRWTTSCLYGWTFVGYYCVNFSLKISNKTPKYPTSASNLLGTFFWDKQNKWQVPNLCLPNICPFVGSDNAWMDNRQKVITIAHPEHSSAELKNEGLLTFHPHSIHKISGPSCSKLTTSLVNDSLKFTPSDTQIC